MAISSTDSETSEDTGRKSRFFSYPSCIRPR